MKAYNHNIKYNRTKKKCIQLKINNQHSKNEDACLPSREVY